MRALVRQGPGPPRPGTAEVPPPGPGPLLVRVAAAGWPVRPGPAGGIPGEEFAGVAERLGAGAYGWERGDEVLGHCPYGACAEFVAVDADRVAGRPEALPWPEAALLPLTAGGAVAAVDALAVRRGETLLVHGAQAPAGRVAVQLALARGAQVVAVAPAAGHDGLRAAGAVPVGYGPDLAARVRAAAPQGVDAVLDAAGRAAGPFWPALAGGSGRVAAVEPPAGGRAGGSAESAALADLVELREAGAFRLVPDLVVPLEEAVAAAVAGVLRSVVLLP
ncbi:NADP-dependent oxidoreductase [Kitasatospora sp. NPDC059571]|uniref:NADP-dependent oxidoreductase n=1 Tax=Kitasatospora sp. NPDC059571 TaxID=3346871 RepID=UPI00367875F7